MQVVHQPALLDGQDLIEGSRDVEADGWYIFGTFTDGEGTNLFLREPTFVRTAKVELVAICLCMYAPQDGHKLGQFHLADTCQLVEDLLLLELQLRLVGQILPLTTTAHTEMFAEGHRAYLTIFYKPHHFALGKGVLLPSDLYGLYRHALKER